MPVEIFYIDKDGNPTDEEHGVQGTMIETDDDGKVISRSRIIREGELEL